MSNERMGRWWSQANSPVIVRMPRGYLVLLIGGVLLLIVLAYWVGGARGYLRAISAMEAGDEPAPMVRREVMSSRSTQRTVAQGGGIAPARKDVFTDTREPGKNYLILARYPLGEAQRLIEFLGERGVEAIGVPAHTRGLFLVIALRGFDRTEVNAEAGTGFKDQMRRIGRAWKAHNGPNADDLASMYFSRYDAPDGASSD